MAKALTFNDIRARLAGFVADWQNAEGYEKGEAQQFVRDLLQCYGLTKRTAALYEKRAKRLSTESHGFIDALVPGVALIEMKSKGRDLVKAESQALDYMDSLTEHERPQYVITCDFEYFRILDLFAPEGEDTVIFQLSELPENAERLGFLVGYQQRTFGSAEQERASIEAAQLMGSLYEEVARAGLDDHEASVFLVRTLFALYADDSGLWRRDLFYEFLELRTSADGADLGAQLSALYQLLNRPEDKRPANLDELLAQFPYVNGGVFGDAISIPMFDAVMRDKLIAACAFNWSAISPAVFGSMFQSVKDAKARRALGEHYTTETNILKLIGPLFLDDLRARFALAQHSVRDLRGLLEELSQIRIADMSAGCGNFLVVSLRELRALELDIWQRLKDLEGDAQLGLFVDDLVKVRLENFAGVEIEEWPAQIATTALYLAQHQANVKMAKTLGMAPDPLPLVKNESIHCANALQVDWRDIVPPPPNGQIYLVGNPPFIGQYTKTKQQTEDTKAVWGKDYDGYLDFVTCWHKKAIDYFGPNINGRFAFVSTNSISQGQPVPALFRPIFEAGWRIRFAHQTFPWVSEAPGMAHVHCVIIGFDRETKPAPLLFTYPDSKGDPVVIPAKNINGYLLDAPNFYVEKRMSILSPQLPPAVRGSQPTDGGNLIVELDDYAEVSADPIANKYLRPFRMGKELIQGLDRWCLWLVDIDPADIKKSGILRTRIEAVKTLRLKSSKKATQKKADMPHLFDEIRQPSGNYLGIPRVFSENRKFATCAWLTSDVIAGDKVYTCIDPDGFAFAIISSSMFITWQKAIGGRLKSDCNFSNTVVWNNLPLPEVPDDLRQKIIQAGQGVLAARAKFPERSLADHYNPLAMDPDLLKAHRELDRHVDRAFGLVKSNPTEADRQQTLFTRYLELTKQEQN